jgi:Tol biopolymer transport system component
MHPIFERLKERKIVQWALAYLAGAWVLYQILDAFGDPWGVTDGFLRLVQVALVAGFFLVLTLAWYHGERGEQRISGAELLILAGIMGLGAIGIRLVTAGVPSVAIPSPDRVWSWGGSPRSVDIGPANTGYLYGEGGTLWFRPWDEARAIAVPGTEGGGGYGAHWLSPNGQIAIVGSPLNDVVRVVRLPDGSPVEVPAAAGHLILGVDDESRVYYGTIGDSLYRAGPGDLRGEGLTARRESERSFRRIRVLPDGRRAVFWVETQSSSVMYSMDLDSRVRIEIGEGTDPVHVSGGYLVYRLEDRLVVAAFDIDEGVLVSDPVTIATGVVAHDVSSDGTALAYRTGGSRSGSEMVWIDRVSGEAQAIREGWTFDHGGANGGWRLSPDGRRIAFRRRTSSGLDIWTLDLESGAEQRLSRHEAEDRGARWAAEGDTVTFLSDRDGDGRPEVWARAADGTGEAHLVFRPQRDISQAFWSPDGEWLILRSTGRLLAYQSGETGRGEIFLRPFPDVDSGKWPVSTLGGRLPVWSPDGRQLYYVRGEALITGLELAVIEIDEDAPRPVGREQVLFPIPQGQGFITNSLRDFYDVTPDGRRVLMVRDDAATTERTVVIEGFADRLKDLLPN